MHKSQKNPFAIVTGMAHSGTTYLSNLIIANTDHANSAFECGVLLSENSPRDFPKVNPFYDWLTHSTSSGHWGLTREDRDWVCNVSSWIEFYDRLATKSPAIKEGQLILDKAPQYVFDLCTVASRAPSTPILVSEKNPFLLYKSYKERGAPLTGFMKKLQQFYNSLEKAQVEHSRQILKVSHRRLTQTTEEELTTVLNFLGCKKRDSISVQLKWEQLPPLSKLYDYEKELVAARSIFTDFEIGTIHNFLADKGLEFDAV